MSYKEKYQEWLEDPILSKEQKDELLSLKDENEIVDRFYTELKFGTAGMRGIVGMGENRMNIYTVGKATSAFAKTLLDIGDWVKNAGVVIAYDCRNMSYEFAHRAAGVLNAYGIEVHMYDGIHPVPMVSFAIRHFRCAAGIMITASHNPKEYNGYKVYGSNGAQLEPENAEKVTSYFSQIEGLEVPFEDINITKESRLFEIIDSSVEDVYIDKVLGLLQRKNIFDEVKDDFSIVYTPLHGAGAGPVVHVLNRAGIKGLAVVESQMMPDSSFSTVRSPNPEETDALERAILLAKEKNADLVMATDPDCDRLGAAIRKKDGTFLTLTGNEIGILLLNYTLLSKHENGTMPKNPAVITTIVTSKMTGALCESYDVECFETLTGFKFICGVMEDLEAEGIYEYVFGFEESHGYLPGDFVRDKDGVQACLVMAEMAAWYKKRGITPYDGLQEIYQKLGFYGEKTVSFRFEGSQGVETMQEIMDNLRENMPTEVNGLKVLKVQDYLIS
ncbi:MAG: phospho-sugar mutase, partial [Clostridiales bacterium]|nr:phospho-sugar mutase [Clostridiales bacterium]